MKYYKKDTMKIHSIHYQRNGVCGNPFYTVYFEDNSDPDFVGQMIATFETANGHDDKIDRRTCRVVNSQQPSMRYRGDIIADNLQKLFNKMEKKTTYGIYEFTEDNKRITALENAGHPIDATFVLNQQTGNTETNE